MSSISSEKKAHSCNVAAPYQSIGVTISPHIIKFLQFNVKFEQFFLYEAMFLSYHINGDIF